MIDELQREGLEERNRRVEEWVLVQQFIFVDLLELQLRRSCPEALNFCAMKAPYLSLKPCRTAK